PWTPPPKHTLHVRLSARGTVTSGPAGIACPSTCAASFDEGLQVTLTVRAKHGFLLDGWTGCTDTDPTCSVVLVRDSLVRPAFSPTLQHRKLSLLLSGHLVARGKLKAVDGYGPCAADEFVQIQRRLGRRWVEVVPTATDESGAFSERIRDRAGTYRA